jgi:hypothetical protein
LDHGVSNANRERERKRTSACWAAAAALAGTLKLGLGNSSGAAGYKDREAKPAAKRNREGTFIFPRLFLKTEFSKVSKEV